MAEDKVYKNETNRIQVIYNRRQDPITLKPGETYVDRAPDGPSIAELLARESDRKKLQADVNEGKRVKKKLAMVRVASTVEELDKLQADETNQDVLDMILLRQKELLYGDNQRGVDA